VVVEEDPLTVEVDGEPRPAWADTGLLGEMRRGDEVVVNVEARDLGLGSGGFDVVHVNLTRGLEGGGAGAGEHVMKLNYTSLQHPVEPVELPVFETPDREGKGTPQGGRRRRTPVLVLPLHGHLAAAAWAAAQAKGGIRVGYVQTAGGALPGSYSRDVAQLRERGLLTGHITAAPSYGGDREAVSVAGAIDAAVNGLDWDAVLVAPGPGIIGSETRLGHGGMAALESLHSALALGLPVGMAPRLSGADPRRRHRPVSHHTLTVLRMLLAPVEIPVPTGNADVTERLTEAAARRHRLREAPADIAGYATSGLPARTMGRSIEEDPLFFEAPLAAGRWLAAG
jgi:hypothetical protein